MIDHQTAVISANAATDNEVVAAVTGKRIVVLGYQIANGAGSAQAVTWKSGSTARTGAMSLPSSVGGALTAPVCSHNRAWLATDPGSALNLTLSGATAVGGVVVYKLA